MLRGSFDQFAGTREIVRRDIRRAQIGYGENIDFPTKLSEIAYHLMGDKQRDRMQSARDCSLWRLVESASESRRKNDKKNDNTSGTQIGGIENWRVASDSAINEIMFADANRRERRRYRSAGEEGLDGGVRRQTYGDAAKVRGNDMHGIGASSRFANGILRLMSFLRLEGSIKLSAPPMNPSTLRNVTGNTSCRRSPRQTSFSLLTPAA